MRDDSERLIPSFEAPAHTLRGHHDVIMRLSWSPDGRTLVSTSVDRTIRFWDWERATLLRTLSGHTQGVNEVAWDPAGRWLASCSYDRTVRIWDLNTGDTIRELHGHSDDVSSVSVAPAGDRLVSASGDKTLRLWRTDTWEEIKVLQGHTDNVYRVTWSPKGDGFASCSKDGTAIIWDAVTLEPKWSAVRTGRRSRPSSVSWSPSGRFLCLTSFDGTVAIWMDPRPGGSPSVDLTHHSGVARSATFSHDERLLATSSGDDTVRLWRTDTWEPLGRFEELTANYWPQGISFHPMRSILATFGERDRAIRIWQPNIDDLLGVAPKHDERAYRNAKVVLLGDTGVGKSALRLVLTGEPYAATESTYSRRVWTFGLDEHDAGGQRETHETLLWDMAGQPGYRLIHQLHLNEVAVAILVFDARQAAADPLASARHWDRALRQAQQRPGTQAVPLKRFLVLGRADIQGVPLPRQRIDAVVREWGLDGFFETSAREGWGIAELARAIREAIDWTLLPQVKSPDYFAHVKDFLLAEKSAGRLIGTADDFYRAFAAAHHDDVPSDPRSVFEVCITRLENRDLVRRLSFGGFILLQPELLDVYASAIIQSAEAEGTTASGLVAEDDALAGRFAMPASERLQERPVEKLLLLATIEELLEHQLVLRESAADGVYLVFPSQFMSDWADGTEAQAQTISMSFEGPVRNLYATLVVRLAHSGEFRINRTGMWKNAAVFSADAGGECCLSLRESPDGRGEFRVFFRADAKGRSAAPHTQYRFEAFLLSHLEKRAVTGSVKLTRHFVCPHCGTAVPAPWAEALRVQGKQVMLCPVDGVPIPLVEPLDQVGTEYDISRMEVMADQARDRGVSEVVLMGKAEIGQYDVFLCYNRKDSKAVDTIYRQLREHKVRPWLDAHDLRPGDAWLDEIEKLIGSVKTAAVFFSSGRAGRVQDMEIRALLRMFADHKVRIIPILLPGAGERPDWSAFLDDFQWVDFQKSDPEPLSQLLFGITGMHSQIQ
jgi:GTPase SAR1 family protein